MLDPASSLSLLLEGYKLPKAMDKDIATYREENGQRHYALPREHFSRAGELIVAAYIAGTWPCLNEIAPPESRVFLDLDTNKHGGTVVTRKDVVKYVVCLSEQMARHAYDKRIRFADIISQVKIKSVAPAPFGWLSSPALEESVATLVGHNFTESEVIQSIAVGFDSYMAVILESHLDQERSTFHVIWPFLFGQRTAAAKLLGDIIKEGLRIYDCNVTAEITAAVDFGVLERGQMRGFLCDKWNSETQVKAGRPFVFSTALWKGEEVTARSHPWIEDNNLIWRATSILLVPTSFPFWRPQGKLFPDLEAEVLAPDPIVAQPPPTPGASREETQVLEDSEESEHSRCKRPLSHSASEVNTAMIRLAIRRPTPRDFQPPNLARKQFADAKDHTMRYVALELSDLIRDWLETKSLSISATDPWERVVDEITPVIVQYLNHSFAFIQSKIPCFVEKRDDDTGMTEWIVRGKKETSLILQGSIVSGIKWGKVKATLKPFEIWLTSPLKLTFKAISMSSGETHEEILRMWYPNSIEIADCAGKLAHTVEHADGTKTTIIDILHHFYAVICGGNIELYTWTLSWFSNLIKNPGIQIGTLPVFIGEEGCGKDFFVGLLCGILGPRLYINTTCFEDLRRFNSLLAGRALFVFNEASPLSPGDYNSLKGLVTDPFKRFESKFFEPEFGRNSLNCIVISNQTTVNLFPDQSTQSRRPVWITASMIQYEQTYWEHLFAWAGVTRGQSTASPCPGAYAFADYLYRLNSDINLMRGPTTEASVANKLATAPKIHLWWFECLQKGDILGAPLSNKIFIRFQQWMETDSETVVETQKLHDLYLDWTNSRGQKDVKSNISSFSRSLHLLFKIRGSVRTWKPEKKKSPSTITIPPLASARALFRGIYSVEFEDEITQAGTAPIEAFSLIRNQVETMLKEPLQDPVLSREVTQPTDIPAAKRNKSADLVRAVEIATGAGSSAAGASAMRDIQDAESAGKDDAEFQAMMDEDGQSM